MLSSEAPEKPFHQAPEAYQGAPELAWTTSTGHNDYSRPNTAGISCNGQIQGQPSKKLSDQRKCGLSPFQLWVFLLLVAFLVVGGIIGGTLGGLAIQRTHVNSASPTGDNSSAKTVTLTSSSSSATADTTSTSSSSIPSSTLHDTGCPASNGTTYSSQYDSRFEILCYTQWSQDENDISDPPAANLEECMEQCALWNALYGPESICRLAVYIFTGKPKGQHDCWLKNVTRSDAHPAFTDMTLASGALL